MSLNLDEIEKALGEITQGEWGIDPYGPRYSISSKTRPFRHITMVSCYAKMVDDEKENEANVHLIAHAPEWLRLLVERVRALESDKEMAEADASHFCAGLCVHPRGVIGDDGGSACCPITGTRDALVDGKKVVL